MRVLGYCVLFICLVVSAPGSVRGDTDKNNVSEASCVILENGVVPELFGVDGALIRYRRSIPVKRAGHVVCSASWDYPDKAELEAEYLKKTQEWGRNMAAGKKEPMPKPPKMAARVSVTLVATQFDSAEAAVTSLEESVAMLEKGLTINVAGKDHTVQYDFGDWIDNVGDKAIFNEKGELLVAYDGKRIAVDVEVSDDPAADRKHAIELARRVMESY